MADFSWSDVLGPLIRGEDLGVGVVEQAMTTILEGQATDAQIAAFAVALRAKGETSTELAALVRTMLRFGETVTVASGSSPLVDTCGTGGDQSGTINVSTAAALVAAGAGVRVAKHGNRASSSKCGSADVLEALGVVIDLGPNGVARCIEEAGIGFCFAPRFHPAMRFAGPARRELGVPTTFNFLGPLANPAGAPRRTVGVSDPEMADRVINTLAELGVERALVFFGHDGLDELTTTTTSTVRELRDGEIHRSVVDPGDVGLPRAEPADLVGGDADTNASVVRRVLDGDHGAARDIVALNAAGALIVAGAVDGFESGVALGVRGHRFRRGRGSSRRAHQGIVLGTRRGGRLMARVVQCPACGESHPLDTLAGTPTFPCAGCGRTLRTPTELVRPSGATPAVRATPKSAPPAAAKATSRPSGSVAAARPRARRNHAPGGALSMPLRVGAWVVAVLFGLLLTWIVASAIGFISRSELVDMFRSSSPGNYIRLFLLIPVWAFMSACLATVLIEGARYFLARRAGVPESAKARRPPTRPAVATVVPDLDPDERAADQGPPPAATPPGQRTRIRPREPTI